VPRIASQDPLSSSHAPRVTEAFPQGSFLRLWRLWAVLLLAACPTLLAACSFPGSVKPTVKIGLSAPFEGLHRDLGYEALHAVRLAVRQRNESGGVGDSYWVELVALNDFDEPEEAVVQAGKMAIDPLVFGVLAGGSQQTARAVAPEYERLGLAFLYPLDQDSIQGAPMLAGPELVEDYEALSGGAPPGPVAAWTYAETIRLLDALDVAARSGERITRAGVQAALGASKGR
jgi:hypothetical protein